MSSIFISHNSRDNQFAERVANFLEQQGYHSLFLDFDPMNGIPAGRNWEKELYANLRKCHVVVVLCSNHFIASNWCFAEITHARALGKYIIPLKIDDCCVSSILLDVQVIDARSDITAAFQRLARGVAASCLDTVPAWDTSRPPYPGLPAFQEQDAATYFGRETETEKLFDALTQYHRFGGAKLLQVLGASGSGKSSLVRAGLVPMLRRDEESWVVVGPFRPLQKPFEELSKVIVSCFGRYHTVKAWTGVCQVLIEDAQKSSDRGLALAAIFQELTEAAGAGEATLLLFIDQFEEVLVYPDKVAKHTKEDGEETTAFSNLTQRVLFLAYLRSFLELSSTKVLCIGTLRSDFLGDFQESEPFKGYTFDSFMVQAITPEGMAKSIAGPAHVAGIELEDGLVDTILKDVPNTEALPLLAFTLRELWEKHGRDDLLTIDEYRNQLGGIGGSVARAAEAVLKAYAAETGRGKLPLSHDNDAVVELNDEVEAQLRIAFMAMVQVNEEGKYIRQLASKDELPAATYDLLERFVKARLLISYGDGESGGDTKIEVAHEVIFRTWTRLVNWLYENREFLLWRRRLSTFRTELKSDVLRGAALEESREWLAKHRSGQYKLKEEEIRYIEQSDAVARQEEIEKEERRRRELRTSRFIVAGLSIVVLIFIIGFGYIRNQNNEIQTQLLKSYWSSSQTAVSDGRLLNALHLAAEAVYVSQYDDLKEGLLLHANALLPPYGLRNILEHDGSVIGAAFVQNGGRVLTWSDDGTARLWDAATGSQLGNSMQHDGGVSGAIFDEREERILTWSYDGTARLWDAAAGSQLVPSLQHDEGVSGAIFNEREERILTWSDDGTARLWDAATGSQLGSSMQHDGGVSGAIFDEREERILTWSYDGTARLWDAATGSQLGSSMQHDEEVYGSIFDEREERILTWSEDGTARLWDAATGSQLGSSMQHDGGVFGAIFDEREERILTWSDDGTARLWDAATGSQLGSSMQHDDWVSGAIFDEREERILTWSYDGAARLWDAATGSQLGNSMQHDVGVSGAIFDEREEKILTWSYDGTARLWDAATGSQLGSSMQHDEGVSGAIFDEREERILTWSYDGTARLWDAAAGSQLVPSLQHDEGVSGAIFNEREERILTWSDDGTARLWDAATGSQLGSSMQHDGGVSGAIFDEREERILTWSYDGTARLWDAATGSQLGSSMQHDEEVYGSIFDEREERILTWSEDGTARLWDAATGSQLGSSMQHDDWVFGAIFDEREERILTWSYDSTARLWDAATGSQLGNSMQHDGGVSGAIFDEREERILTWSYDGTARLWDAATGSQLGSSMQHDEGVSGAIFDEREERILTWSDDGTARLWDAATGSQLGSSMQHDGGVFGAIFDEREERILTWSYDGTARLWDAATGSQLGSSMQHDEEVSGAIFDEREERILTWSYDGTARLWDAATGRQLVPSLQHDKGVTGAIFDEREERILTWSDDGTARLWDAITGWQFGTAKQHEGLVTGAIFDEREERILTWSDGGTARLWDLGGDFDLPSPLFKLQAQAATGVELHAETGNIELIQPNQWRQLQIKYYQEGREHYEKCHYPANNVWAQFYSKEANEIRPNGK